MFSPFCILLRLELTGKARDWYALILPLVFFLCLVLLFPLMFTARVAYLTSFAAGICWLATLLSLMLYLDRIFRDDYHQGSLDLLLGSAAGSQVIAARILACWLMIAVPLCILAVALGFLLGLPGKQLTTMLAALLCGSAILVLIGSVIASLCLSAARATMLIGVLLLPLLTPVVIFGVEASKADANWQMLLLLFGGACINLAVCPLLCSLALRATID